jgi:hypothetical protein
VAVISWFIQPRSYGLSLPRQQRSSAVAAGVSVSFRVRSAARSAMEVCLDCGEFAGGKEA